MSYDDHNLPQLKPLEESTAKEEDFFGPSAERLLNIANQMKDEYGEASTEYGAAMVAVGNAHVVGGAQSLGNGLLAYEEALKAFSAVEEDSELCADAHHRIASVLRRRGEHEPAAQHLRRAIAIWKRTGSADVEFVHRLQRLQEDLDLMREIHQSGQYPKLPPRI